MHVRVDRRVVRAFGFDHAPRLLTGRGIVEIHERLAVHQFLQDRELRTDLLDIISLGYRCGLRLHSESSFLSIKLERYAFQSMLVTRSNTSAVNACASNWRASS